MVASQSRITEWKRLTHNSFKNKRKALDRKAPISSPEHLDLDLLDELVRATLNLVAPNEVVIMREGTAALTLLCCRRVVTLRGDNSCFVAKRLIRSQFGMAAICRHAPRDLAPSVAYAGRRRNGDNTQRQAGWRR